MAAKRIAGGVSPRNRSRHDWSPGGAKAPTLPEPARTEALSALRGSHRSRPHPGGSRLRSAELAAEAGYPLPAPARRGKYPTDRRGASSLLCRRPPLRTCLATRRVAGFVAGGKARSPWRPKRGPRKAFFCMSRPTGAGGGGPGQIVRPPRWGGTCCALLPGAALAGPASRRRFAVPCSLAPGYAPFAPAGRKRAQTCGHPRRKGRLAGEGPSAAGDSGIESQPLRASMRTSPIVAWASCPCVAGPSRPCSGAISTGETPVGRMGGTPMPRSHTRSPELRPGKCHRAGDRPCTSSV
jgi:hypothetical protein